MARDDAVPTERGVEEGGTGASAPVPPWLRIAAVLAVGIAAAGAVEFGAPDVPGYALSGLLIVVRDAVAMAILVVALAAALALWVQEIKTR